MFAKILLLILAAAIWGHGFIASRWTLESYSPLWSNSFRYLLSALFALPIIIFYRSWKHHYKTLLLSFYASMMLLSGMFFQVYGIKYTTVAKSGFLTTFYAFFVPLIGILIHKKRYMKGYWFLMFLAFVGIAMLCDLKIEGVNKGDLLTIGCALCFAIHIDYLGKVANSLPSALEFNALQCFFMGLVAVPLALLIEGPIDLSAMKVWPIPLTGPLSGFLILAFFSSIVAFSIQVWGQQTIPPHVAGPLFLLESPFAVLFGFIFLNETLNVMNILGCSLVVVSVLAIPRFGKELIYTPPREYLS